MPILDQKALLRPDTREELSLQPPPHGSAVAPLIQHKNALGVSLGFSTSGTREMTALPLLPKPFAISVPVASL